jgi:hypothetical protein
MDATGSGRALRRSQRKIQGLVTEARVFDAAILATADAVAAGGMPESLLT